MNISNLFEVPALDASSKGFMEEVGFELFEGGLGGRTAWDKFALLTSLLWRASLMSCFKLSFLTAFSKRSLSIFSAARAQQGTSFPIFVNSDEFDR